MFHHSGYLPVQCRRFRNLILVFLLWVSFLPSVVKAQPAAEQAVTEKTCLGVEALGSCPFDLAQPTLTFFSIGQLVSVIALVLTFSQLLRTLIKFRLKNSRATLWGKWGVAATIVCVFVAAMLRMTSVARIPVLGYPIVWEFLGGVIFVAASYLMISRTATRATLAPYNAKKYFDGCDSVITRGHIEELREFTAEIIDSIPIAVAACARHQNSSRMSSLQSISQDLLALWANKQFCEVMVTRNPDTAITIISAIQRYKLYNGDANELIQQIIHQAFSCEDSILHREHKRGSSGSGKFITAAFSDVEFVVKCGALGAWHILPDSKISEDQVAIYRDAIDRVLMHALHAEQIEAIVSSLSDALQIVNRIAARAAGAINDMSELQFSESALSGLFRECLNFHLVVFAAIIAEQQRLRYQEASIDPANYKPYDSSDKTVYGVIASALFEFIKNLSFCQRHDDFIRVVAVVVWNLIFPVTSQDQLESTNPAWRAIQTRFIALMLREVAVNLDPRTATVYPLVTRMILLYFDVPSAPGAPASPPTGREEHDFHVEVFNMIQNRLLPVKRDHPERVANLLPKYVEYLDSPPRLHNIGFGTRDTALRLLDE